MSKRPTCADSIPSGVGALAWASVLSPERAQTPAAVTTKSVAKPSRIPARRSQLTSTG
jgi:hypothetical protein